ncbi:uncharacterized protein LOC143590413 [Bidens hawaiensis]|uniref:uncharacterized protein LOC143590413 n=1 Tax=Bidens hawaiensis TaxID=980011 RepID=UPI00404AD26B
MKYQNRQTILDHLICSGFRPEYFKWVYHREGTTNASTSTNLNKDEAIHNLEMHEMLNDMFETKDRNGVDMHENASNNSQETNNNRNNFDKLVKEAVEKVYRNCKFNKFSCVVHLYHIKCLNGWSTKSLSMLLEFLMALLPEGNLLLETAQQLKKFMANLGLGYEKIHSCPNGCMFFWDDQKKDEVFSFCGSSRWKVYESSSEDKVSAPKKKASKILRWFPIKPRLKRLFISSKTSMLMKWHHTEHVKDGKLCHPADALVWKNFDEKFPEFASEPRSVRHPPDAQYLASYANLSGWSTKGKFACPVCGFGTDSKWLTYGRKWCYMCHRRCLPSDHSWRSDVRSFVGESESRIAHVPPSRDEVLQQLDDMEFFVDNDAICYKDFSEDYLHFLNSKVALTLCKLEKIFPPTFFTVMVHLVVHLTREVKLGGPVAFRWMYPIESFSVCERSLDIARIDNGDMYVKDGCVARMEEQGDEVTEYLKWLARGPLRKGENYTSSRDRRHVQAVINYYGKLNEIIELNYSGQIRVVLFKCDWVDINMGCKIDNGVTLVNFSYKAHTGVNLTDDPFVLATQVDKVFFVTDPKHKDWEVVRHVKVRNVYNMGSVDQVGPYSKDSPFDLPNLHMIGDDGEVGIYITPDMEHEEDVEENDDNYLILF